MSVRLLRANELNALQKREAHTDCDGVYGFRVKDLRIKKSFVSNKKQMSVFPLGKRVLLYVWKVVRVVIQRGCRRCCMLAAWQPSENGPRQAISRAFVCLCLTRRLLVHRSTASTHLAKEQSGHYQPYLIPTLPQLTDTQGQTAAGLSRSALLGDSEADTEADWEVH